MARRLLQAAVLVVVMLLPVLTPLTASAGPSFNVAAQSFDEAVWRAKIHPSLLDGGAYGSGLPGLGEVVEGAAGSGKLVAVDSPPAGLARVAVYFHGGREALAEIRERVYRVTSALATGSVGVAYALATKSQVEELARLPFVAWIEPQRPLTDLLEPAKPPVGEAATGILQGGGGQPGYAFYSAPKLLGAERVWEEYGITGEGVKVGVVDTGIDMGSPDLGASKIARDEHGIPLLFDADMVGFVYTGNPTIRVDNDTIYIPGWKDGYIVGFFPLAGEFVLDYSAWVYALNSYTNQSFFLEINIVNDTYTIPSEVKGNVMFGLDYQLYYLYPTASSNVPFGGVVLLATPVVVVDVDGDEIYDGAYADLSTAYYLLMEALHNLTGGAVPEPPESLADKSFADEPFATYGSEVLARDFTGDGVPDFSLGAIAGALYDYWGVFGDTYYHDWISDWEPGALVVPGLDIKGGMWVDIVYDFHGHGTSVAHVIAASGEVERPVQGLGFQGTVTMPGIAKGAKIGGAPALFNGDVLTAQLWLAGFDLVDPETFTWNYTGEHQVDVISNSWGSSWLLYTGYSNDADPLSLWEAYIMAVSGTVIVHAAGNGGPGWGTVTIPGASPFIITVGAATDFYYRPFYGAALDAAYPPGGWGQVISWSDRGPTQQGYPKPDVVNIGSFEWAGTRAIDAAWDGRYAYDLFGGTSEATPMTSGVVALVIQALREAGVDYDPFLVKVILKSTATDTGYNPFSQGSGFVNAYAAVKAVLEGGVIAYSSQSPMEILKLVDETFAALLGSTPGEVQRLFQEAGVKDTAIYPGVLKPGDSKTVELRVKVLGGGSAEVRVSDYTLHKTGSLPLSKALSTGEAFIVYMKQDYTLGVVPAAGFITAARDGRVYLNLAALPPGVRLVIPVAGDAVNADFAVLDLALPAGVYFEPNPEDPYGRPDLGKLAVLLAPELSVWFDVNGNGVPDAVDGYWEVARLGYDIRLGPVAHLEIGNPRDAIMKAAEAAASVLGASPEELAARARLVVDLRVYQNNYFNVSGYEAVPLDGGLSLYERGDCMMVTGYPDHVAVEGEAVIPVEVTVPNGTAPGVYEAYVTVEAGSQRILVPVSIPVALVVDLSSGRMTFDLTGAPQPFLYDNYAFRGALDQGWRPETGDWRTYPILVKDPGRASATLTVNVYWSNPNSGYDAGLIGPGLNLWGVADSSFIAYVDSAVLGAKLTMPYITGVYGYFDWPRPGMASFTAPLDSLRSLRAGEEYTLYWLVVHQKVSDSAAERVVVTLSFGRVVGDRTITAPQGGAATGVFAYYGPQYMPYTPEEKVLDVAVIPLEGQESTPSVSASVYTGGSGSVRIYTVDVDASNADAGAYLAVAVTYSTATSVVVGTNTGHGSVAVLYATPLIYNVPFQVNVAGGR
ncbi:S8 family serine peptidase [Stetteria hydrogenophila]